jgi:hypothetical protein
VAQRRASRDLDRRQLGMKAQEDALVAAHLLLAIGVEQEGQQRPIDAGRRLDDERHDVFLALLVEPRERLAAELRVLLEVEVRPVGDAHQLAPAHRELVEQIDGALGVVGQLVAGVLVQLHVRGIQAIAREPRLAVGDPAIVPGLVGRPAIQLLVRVDEELDLHLLELARAKDEVAGRDLVTERLADLGDAERQLPPHRLEHVVEVDEDALGGLRPEVGDGGVFLHRAHERLEHQVELARGGKLTLAALRAERAPGPAVLAGLPGGDDELVALRRLAVMRPWAVIDLVGAEASLALPAVDHGVGEVIDVAAGLPHRGVHQDRGVQAHHVGALLDEVAPPHVLDVVPELDAERAVIPA